MIRKTWSEYFMMLATQAATRSTCKRAQVGCVIVHDENKTILTTGYNGMPSGLPHCCDDDCMQLNGHCISLHAEQNAIIQASKNGVRIDGAWAFCTHQPCLRCLLMLAQANVSIAYLNQYRIGNEREAAIYYATVEMLSQRDHRKWRMVDAKELYESEKHSASMKQLVKIPTLKYPPISTPDTF